MDLSYIVQRSEKRKSLTITVERDRTIIVHAPSHASNETIEQVVETRRQWISEKIKHRQKYQELPHPPGKGWLILSRRITLLISGTSCELRHQR